MSDPGVRVSKLQLKLMASLGGLVLFVVLVAGVLAEQELREREMARLSSALEQSAALVEALAQDVSFSLDDAVQLDDIADRAGQAAGLRVTLIASDGTVVGDSDVPLARIAGVENHARRPEVAAALAGHTGTDARRSRTVGRDLFYLARPTRRGGVVRVAVDLSALESSVADLRRELLTTGVIGLIASLAVSFFVSGLTLRPVRELRRVVSSIARGDLDTRMPLRPGDELGEISSAINQMAEQLGLRLTEANQEKERLRAVLEGMVEAVLVVDAKGQIVLANERLREFYRTSSEIVGRTVLAALRDASLDALLSQAAETDEPVSGSVSAGAANLRTLSVHAARFPRGSGPRVGTVAVLHDVTESARLDRMRRDFVANASHELRTPLAAIRGFAETLLDGGALPAADRRSYLEVIDRHARRLGRLVDDLLELSRIESGSTRLERTSVDVARVTEGWLRDAQARLAERQLEASCRVEGRSLAWADPGAVEQILTNLLENAVYYTEPGGSIEVTITGDGRDVRVDVRDTGIGIPEPDLDRIFERFYRVDKARSRTLGGTGLGLSIVKHLVQALGGSVRVASELGKGSIFTVTLPAAR